MMQVFTHIKKIAKEVRVSYVRASIKAPEYPVDQALKWDLSCECAKASYELWKALAAEGISTELALVEMGNEEGHVFVLYEGKGIDITASQYNCFDTKFPPVYIFEEEAGHGKISFKSENPVKFSKELKKRGWPEWQIYEI